MSSCWGVRPRGGIPEGRRVGASVTYERPAPETLVYMRATDTTLYAKVVGRETDSFVARLNEKGRV